MDAGGVALVGAIAAVLGAAVGAGGAIVSASITSRKQALSQHAQWRREVRREAYTAFLSHSFKEQRVHEEVLEAGRDGRTSVAEADSARYRETYNARLQAMALVALEGPERAAAGAKVVFFRQVAARSTLSNWLARGAPWPDQAVTSAMNGLDEAIGSFMGLARLTLDKVNSRTR
ncbi:hypothetical protein ACFCZ2_27700 [Streptomyces sp. NPDC056202]|uniref:hypothetical protein n=1 Tax=Streptomyces sp. NPDC056202 TaxID=3345745 RepID=UPI0035DB4E8B